MPTQALVDFIIARNAKQSAEFIDPGVRLSRIRYRAEHPTEIVALKCMDGRLNLSVMTQTPPGIIQPFRNVGGRFNLGWPFFQTLIREGVEYASNRGRHMLVFLTYHYAKGDTHRGCKGFGYDTDAARAAAMKLREQFEGAFGTSHATVYPVVVGIETDEESLVFHGKNGETLSVTDCLEDDVNVLESKLHTLFGDMHPRILADLIPFVLGNAQHTTAMKAMNRPIVDLDHKEQIIAVGRGFDWLHLPNKALIIGPYDPEWLDAVATAARIIESNMEAGRVPTDDGALLLVNAPHREIGHEEALAREKAKYILAAAKQKIEKDVPEIASKLSYLAGTTNLETRAFTPLAEFKK